MTTTIEAKTRPLLEAVAFAARAHRHQLRKDKETPYVSHVFRACLIVRDVFGISDTKALIAAVLHDTLEDTTTDFDDLEKHFGQEIAEWVALLSKDTRQPEPAREKAYMKQLAKAPWQVHACKLADVFDNLMDSGHLTPAGRSRAIQRAEAYLGAIESHLTAAVEKPFRLVSQLLQEVRQK
jgi:guanosine-3',5'-bis(diphosphate) 3'-pyrophosphohydrolase